MDTLSGSAAAGALVGSAATGALVGSAATGALVGSAATGALVGSAATGALVGSAAAGGADVPPPHADSAAAPPVSAANWRKRLRLIPLRSTPSLSVLMACPSV